MLTLLSTISSPILPNMKSLMPVFFPLCRYFMGVNHTSQIHIRPSPEWSHDFTSIVAAVFFSFETFSVRDEWSWVNEVWVMCWLNMLLLHAITLMTDPDNNKVQSVMNHLLCRILSVEVKKIKFRMAVWLVWSTYRTSTCTKGDC